MISRASLLTALILAPAVPVSAAETDPFSGVGAWVSVFEDSAWQRPERVVRQMHRHGVTTLYLQSASSQRGPAVFRPPATARFLRAAHKRGMRVVAWYLPPYVDPAYERRRALRAIRFRTAAGDAFDAFALDIETAPGSPTVPVRNRRLLRLSRHLRRAVGPDYALGAIIPSPYGLTLPLGRRWWPDFPYRALRSIYGTFLPMGYYTYHGDGPANAYRDTRLNLAILRRETGDPAVPIHIIGGSAERSGVAEGRAFARAVNRYGAIGASMYSHTLSGPEDWRALDRLRFRPAASPGS